jgi:hypothetical protein
MFAPTPRLLSLVALGILLLAPAPASAGIPIPIIWGEGDEIDHVQDLPPQLKQELAKEVKGMPSSVAVGFHYKRLHVFWANLWTWEGTYCLYAGDQYWPLTLAQVVALTGKSESDFSKPFLYKFPLGLLILGGVILLIVAGSLLSRSSGPSAPASPLAQMIPEQPAWPVHFCFNQLYQPDEVLQQRLPSPEAFAQYGKALDQAVADFAKDQTLSGQALSLFVAVRPGGQSRFWLEFAPDGVPEEARQDLLRRLEAVPPPEVHGPVALASYLLLWGGPGTRENLFSFIPREWTEALGPDGGVIPDDALRKIWS